MVKSIELILENCQVITIESKYLGVFNLEDIREDIRRVACNSIEKVRTCRKLELGIHRSANVLQDEEWILGASKEKSYPFDRLVKYDDITGVVVNYEDGSSEEVCVQWGDENCWCNTLQKSYMSNGNLYIVVGDGVPEELEMSDVEWSLMVD